jgi:hypothetical protein
VRSGIDRLRVAALDLGRRAGHRADPHVEHDGGHRFSHLGDFGLQRGIG